LAIAVARSPRGLRRALHHEVIARGAHRNITDRNAQRLINGVDDGIDNVLRLKRDVSDRFRVSPFGGSIALGQRQKRGAIVCIVGANRADCGSAVDDALTIRRSA
jgi:hypothetical protein